MIDCAVRRLNSNGDSRPFVIVFGFEIVRGCLGIEVHSWLSGDSRSFGGQWLLVRSTCCCLLMK